LRKSSFSEPANRAGASAHIYDRLHFIDCFAELGARDLINVSSGLGFVPMATRRPSAMPVRSVNTVGAWMPPEAVTRKRDRTQVALIWINEERAGY
jgi:hypothetical protein